MVCCQGFILAGVEEAGWLPDVLGSALAKVQFLVLVETVTGQ